MHFAAITVKLISVIGHPPISEDGPYAHAALLNLFTDADPVRAKQLHDMSRHKCFTIAIMKHLPSEAILRTTFMGLDSLTYLSLFMNVLAQRPPLRLGHKVCKVDAITINSNINKLSQVSTWNDLTDQTASSSMRFEFITPTAIMKSDGLGGRFTSVYPDTTDVFMGLTRRWQALNGPPLPSDLESFLRSGGCVVARHSLETVSQVTPKRTQIGFTGFVVYECRRQIPAYMNALNALRQGS